MDQGALFCEIMIGTGGRIPFLDLQYAVVLGPSEVIPTGTVSYIRVCHGKPWRFVYDRHDVSYTLPLTDKIATAISTSLRDRPRRVLFDEVPQHPAKFYRWCENVSRDAGFDGLFHMLTGRPTRALTEDYPWSSTSSVDSINEDMISLE